MTNLSVLDGIFEASRSTIHELSKQHKDLDAKDLLPHLTEALGNYSKGITVEDESMMIRNLIKISALSLKGAMDYINKHGIRLEVE